MFILKIIRLLRGYVLFVGTGGFPERFLNLCACEGIEIWNVKHNNGVLTANAVAGKYHLLRHCASKAGMKLRVSQRYGLAFLLYRYRKRVGLLVGAAVFVLILVFSSNYVWTIRVEGNVQMQTQAVLQTMEELGLRTGVMRSRLDISAMQLAALGKMPELSWISVNIRGSVATVEVRERIMPPDMLDESVACNVVAAQDGCIVRLEAYEGNASVRVGEAVVKGDLLISGVMESKLETTRFVHARGTVIANTSKRLEAAIPLIREELIPTGEEKQRYSPELFGLRISLDFFVPRGEDWVMVEDENRLRVFGMDLPFALYGEKYCRVEKTSRRLTEEEARNAAREELERQKAALGDIKILEVKEECTFDSSTCTMVWNIVCEENIGVTEEILFDDNM